MIGIATITRITHHTMATNVVLVLFLFSTIFLFIYVSLPIGVCDEVNHSTSKHARAEADVGSVGTSLNPGVT